MAWRASSASAEPACSASVRGRILREAEEDSSARLPAPSEGSPEGGVPDGPGPWPSENGPRLVVCLLPSAVNAGLSLRRPRVRRPSDLRRHRFVSENLEGIMGYAPWEMRDDKKFWMKRL